MKNIYANIRVQHDSRGERKMDKKYLINLDWQFKEGFKEEYIGSHNQEAFESVHIPHNVKEVDYNYFSDTCMLGEYTYIKEIEFEKELESQRILLEFQGIMTYFELYVNACFVGSHKGGYTGALLDITDAVKLGEKNRIVLKVDTSERSDIPPFGNVIDYITYGGIYRDVFVHTVNPTYIEKVLYKYDIEVGQSIEAKPELIIVNKSSQMSSCTIKVELQDSEEQVVNGYSQALEVNPGRHTYTLTGQLLENIQLWDLENPYLYTVKVTLEGENSSLDTHTIRTGFRKVEVAVNGFYLNNKKVKLVGLNRHQSYPYVGYAMGKRAQRKDADILKDELGLNTVRTSHYPQSQYFLDRCDEIGLLVFEEIPGWQYVGKNETFREVVLENVRDMILTDFNHPSIFIWGVRINESLDDDELYTKTNALSRELDSTRPTGGVRCITNSHMLEDVYTMNDFIHWGDEAVLRDQREVTGLPYKVPYMVTEYGGHIYPTKKFDNEQRLIEHCLRHARVQSQMMLRKDIMGAIGWCAFDYNTHSDFGSGDKICYHGVMDMYRIPKFASYVYKSQLPPTKEVVLEPVTYFSRGEKDRGVVAPVVVMTNCDYVELVIGGKSMGRFFPSGNYAGLVHPPIVMNFANGEWGDRWADSEFIGYINEERVISKKYVANNYLNDLKVVIDDTELLSTEVDTTRVCCTFVDQIGNNLPYYNGVIQIETEGDVEVIGAKTVAVIGGSIAFWIKTKANLRSSVAKVTVKALNTMIADKVLDINIK